LKEILLNFHIGYFQLGREDKRKGEDVVCSRDSESEKT